MPKQPGPVATGSRMLVRLLKNLNKHQVDGLLVTHLANLRYLFGFSGSTAAALVTSRGCFLFLDSRYVLQGRKETVGCSIELVIPSLEEVLAQKVESLGLRCLGIEGLHLSFCRYQSLRTRLPKRVRVKSLVGLVEELRMVKTIEEIEEIERTLNLTVQAFDAIIPAVKPGIRERDLATELEYRLRRLGARKTSFDTIVASGPRSSMPHALASNRVLQKNEFVVFDFGAYRKAYASDMTRTVFLGKPTSEQRRIYATVLEAITRAEERVRPGLSSRTVDRFARSQIEKSGFGDYFGHGTGHGIGLEVHEAPFINPHQNRRIRRNMVFTIEPGIYLPNKDGVRIEDIVRVTDNGCTVLTRFTKELIVL